MNGIGRHLSPFLHMKICTNCGIVLRDGDIIREQIFEQYMGSSGFIIRYCCPYCRGTLLNADYCENCGECVDENNLIIVNGRQICYDCAVKRENIYEDNRYE